MSLRDLLVVYLVVGVACAAAVLHRARAAREVRGAAVVSALVTVPLWPLWAPFALAPRRTSTSRSVYGAIVNRVHRALDEATAAARGTPMSNVLSPKASARMATEVARVAARLEELDVLATGDGFDRVASARRLEELAEAGASDRAVATARLHHEGLERLARLRAADENALAELADLLDALRTQLVLARYSGSSADGATAMVFEVFVRLESLGAVLDPSLVDDGARASS